VAYRLGQTNVGGMIGDGPKEDYGHDNVDENDSLDLARGRHTRVNL
jgi:hypothetical protein